MHCIITTVFDNNGYIEDGEDRWDGTGNFVRTAISGQRFVVGERYAAAANKYRPYTFVSFDISSLGTGTVHHAELKLYYQGSFGNGVENEAPNSEHVGHLIVDHIENWEGALISSDYQIPYKDPNIGTLISDDIPPACWVSIPITSQLQNDIDEQDPTNTSSFRLRQSYLEDYEACISSNYWIFSTYQDTGFEPRIEVCFTES